MDDRVPMGRTCAWCSAAAPVEATVCPSCGAAMAQRESIGDLVIPGVTNVDPALLDIANRPLHIAGSSPTQGMAGGVMVAAAAGGPIGLAALGGMAIVGAAEYARAGRRSGGAPEGDEIGRPSDVARLAVERLASEEAGAPAAEAPPDPWRDEPGRRS